MEELAIRRREKQPWNIPVPAVLQTSRGTFRRAADHGSRSAGILRRRRKGIGKHCGFIINTGNATAEDVKDVIWEVQRRVKERFHVELEPEIKFL